MRTFSKGDPGLPTSGLLVGSGGGLTWVYDDFALHSDGKIEKLRYITEEGPIPPDFKVTGRGKSDAQTIEKFQTRLVEIGFWNLRLDPPLSDMFHYLVAADQNKGVHFVLWGPDADRVPPEVKKVYDDVVEIASRAV
jgi:hypothetical protein